MEYVIIFALVASHISLSSKIDKLINMQKKESKKYFSSLNELIGKKISIETDDDSSDTFGYEKEGILKEFDDRWIVLETTDKKDKKNLFYYRLSNVTSIDIVKND